VDEHLERFSQFIASWAPAYRSISTSYLIVQRGDKSDLISARLVLHPLPRLRLQTRTSVKSARMQAGLSIAPATDANIAEALEQVANGSISLKGRSYSLPSDAGRTFRPWSHLDVPVGDVNTPRLPRYQVTGGSRNVALGQAIDSRTADWYLRGLNPPFQDFDDLISTYGLPGQHSSGDETQIEVLAYAPLQIKASSTISAGVASVSITVAGGLDNR
jgi:hypothetical protein